MPLLTLVSQKKHLDSYFETTFCRSWRHFVEFTGSVRLPKEREMYEDNLIDENDYVPVDNFENESFDPNMMGYSDYESYRVVKKSRQNPVEDLPKKIEALFKGIADLPREEGYSDMNHDVYKIDNINHFQKISTEEEILEKYQMRSKQRADDRKTKLEDAKTVFESLKGGFAKIEAVI
ncbi:hypothetical protein INT47_004029 [Mucor saturninus]|uniref:Uncharacterized protein n=1 Tax=Mucor saturninus TaxID=64648 RepID=A0A8H7RA18_9FUNG|nr:hypothetical protein INT47_004029 [Mucor saturninus]